jgi:predicted nucleotidyltransferase
VILFGSAARGEMHRDSDIDLIIISPDFKKMGFIERLILLSKLREGMKKSAPMDIFGYTPEEFERLSKESIVLKEAKREGKIIR